MARTTINFEYDGKEYCLAYTIDVVKRLDSAGLLGAIINGERPLTMTAELFKAAFEANHPTVSNRIRENILVNLKESSEDGSLLECLLEMVNEVYRELAPKGNVEWGKSQGN